MNSQLDVNEVVNDLLDQISHQAREIAMLRVQLNHVNKQLTAPVEEETSGNDSV